MIIMDPKFDLRNNCLTLIKLIAALQVMLSHVIEHLELPFSKWPGIVLGFYNGVPVFFVISGFLIWFSMERSSSYGGYLKKRFWRIYPELWVAVIVDIITIIIFYSGWNVKDLVLFAFSQGSILQFWTPDPLRGYGCGTPNGTLWTICVMVQFYIIAWLIHRLMHKRKWIFWLIGFAVLIGICIGGQWIAERTGMEIVIKLYGQTVLRYGWLFYIGCFIAEFKDRLRPVLSRFWYLFLIVSVAPYLTHVDLHAGYEVFWSMLLVSGLIGFAYAFPRLSVKTDISYGIFLYHMIIVNIFIQMEWLHSWGYAVIIMLIAALLAFGSAKTIGAWAARKKA